MSDLKCIFCSFTGDIHALRVHSEDCLHHPAVIRLAFARQHWYEAQARLAVIEQRLIELNGGHECGSEDSLSIIADKLREVGKI
jgi:hypothetical protein